MKAAVTASMPFQSMMGTKWMPRPAVAPPKQKAAPVMSQKVGVRMAARALKPPSCAAGCAPAAGAGAPSGSSPISSGVSREAHVAGKPSSRTAPAAAKAATRQSHASMMSASAGTSTRTPSPEPTCMVVMAVALRRSNQLLMSPEEPLNATLSEVRPIGTRKAMKTTTMLGDSAKRT